LPTCCCRRQHNRSEPGRLAGRRKISKKQETKKKETKKKEKEKEKQEEKERSHDGRKSRLVRQPESRTISAGAICVHRAGAVFAGTARRQTPPPAAAGRSFARIFTRIFAGRK
jgi:hypothetical protein